eukprot:3888635-Rhodomonas_salina.1
MAVNVMGERRTIQDALADLMARVSAVESNPAQRNPGSRTNISYEDLGGKVTRLSANIKEMQLQLKEVMASSKGLEAQTTRLDRFVDSIQQDQQRNAELIEEKCTPLQSANKSLSSSVDDMHKRFRSLEQQMTDALQQLQDKMSKLEIGEVSQPPPKKQDDADRLSLVEERVLELGKKLEQIVLAGKDSGTDRSSSRGGGGGGIADQQDEGKLCRLVALTRVGCAARD